MATKQQLIEALKEYVHLRDAASAATDKQWAQCQVNAIRLIATESGAATAKSKKLKIEVTSEGDNFRWTYPDGRTFLASFMPKNTKYIPAPAAHGIDWLPAYIAHAKVFREALDAIPEEAFNEAYFEDRAWEREKYERECAEALGFREAA